MRAVCGLLCALSASGCAVSRPDHFHILAGPSRVLEARSAFVMQVNLHVSLPTVVDRSEMVLSNAGGVTVFEHERWAAPLSEQFSNILGQDIEARRPGVIVTTRSIAKPDGPMTTIAVEVVELSLRKNLGATLEARWRVQHGSEVAQGRETFTAAPAGAGFDGLVQSLNVCIGSLADRLDTGLP